MEEDFPLDRPVWMDSLLVLRELESLSVSWYLSVGGLKRTARYLQKMQKLMLRAERPTTSTPNPVGQESTAFYVRMDRTIEREDVNAVEDAAFAYNPNSDDLQWRHCTLRDEGDRLVEDVEGLGEDGTTVRLNDFDSWEDMLKLKVYCKLP
jgi:hypothetical protein